MAEGEGMMQEEQQRRRRGDGGQRQRLHPAGCLRRTEKEGWGAD